MCGTTSFISVNAGDTLTNFKLHFPKRSEIKPYPQLLNVGVLIYLTLSVRGST